MKVQASGNSGSKGSSRSGIHLTLAVARARARPAPAKFSLMHIEFLVEDLSTEAALELLVPKIVDVGTSFATHVFGSKSTLLAKLEARLRSYSHWLPPTWRIIVVVDEDRADCRAIKKKLESASRAATLKTKGAAKGKPFSILNRIAIEELEAWFFGDVPDRKSVV